MKSRRLEKEKLPAAPELPPLKVKVIEGKLEKQPRCMAEGCKSTESEHVTIGGYPAWLCSKHRSQGDPEFKRSEKSLAMEKDPFGGKTVELTSPVLLSFYVEPGTALHGQLKAYEAKADKKAKPVSLKAGYGG